MSKRKEQVDQEQARARKQTLQIAGIIGTLAVVLIGGAILISRSRGDTSPTEVPLPNVRVSTKAVPANAEPNGIAWGPKDAPIKIEEFIDYQCPGCRGQWSQYEEEIIGALAATGKVRYEYNFLTFLETRPGGRNDSSNAANGAMCAADQGKFFELHNTLFNSQFEENVGQFSPQRIKEMGKLIGLADVAKFDACIDAGTHKGRLAPMSDDASKRAVDSTPTFFVNGKKYTGSQSLADLRKIFAEVAPTVKVE
jgi:protein-disulfide isomerase